MASGLQSPVHIPKVKRRDHSLCDSRCGVTVDFPGGPVVSNLPANAGDTGSIPGPGRSHIPSHIPSNIPWDDELRALQ